LTTKHGGKKTRQNGKLFVNSSLGKAKGGGIVLTLLGILFDPVTWTATLRMATPTLFAGVGGSFSRQTGTFCIAFECFMLSSAFFAAYGSYLTGSPYLGSLLAILTGMLLAALFALFVFNLRANAIIISIAFNFGAWAVTTLLLTNIFDVRGFFFSPEIINFPPIHIPILKDIPLVGGLLSGHILLVYLAYASAIVGYVIMYKTPFGLQLRGVGASPAGAQTSGVNLAKYRWATVLIMGACSGLGGAYLPLSGLSMFSESMTSGRGFIAFAAILVGRGNPVKVMLVSLLFAYASALNMTLTNYGVPTQLLQTLPYLMVLAVLLISGIKHFNGKARLEDDLV
jgi:simple sugar transport system permease protein